jgi:hypothetical protein
MCAPTAQELKPELYLTSGEPVSGIRPRQAMNPSQLPPLTIISDFQATGLTVDDWTLVG